MDSTVFEHTFITPAIQEEWEKFLQNSEDLCNEKFKGQWDNRGILSHFKKCFGVTPYSLKNNLYSENGDLRYLALYILSNYSKESLESIAHLFSIPVSEVQLIKNDSAVREREQDRLAIYFKDIHSTVLYNYKANLNFKEMIMRTLQN